MPAPLRPDALSSEMRAAAQRVLDYLSVTDPLPPVETPADAVMGFGLFDLKLPRHCGDLFRRGLARRIILSGGIGVGTGNIVGAEADAWRAELRRSHPAIRDADVIVENKSTNTGDNLLQTTLLLQRDYPALAFGRGLQRVILVASPSRLRRVRLTFLKQHPALVALGTCPPSTLEQERAAYAENGYDYLAHLVGELDRIEDYPKRGFIAAEPLPAEIVAAREVLRAA